MQSRFERGSGSGASGVSKTDESAMDSATAVLGIANPKSALFSRNPRSRAFPVDFPSKNDQLRVLNV